MLEFLLGVLVSVPYSEIQETGVVASWLVTQLFSITRNMQTVLTDVFLSFFRFIAKCQWFPVELETHLTMGDGF